MGKRKRLRHDPVLATIVSCISEIIAGGVDKSGTTPGSGAENPVEDLVDSDSAIVCFGSRHLMIEMLRNPIISSEHIWAHGAVGRSALELEPGGWLLYSEMNNIAPSHSYYDLYTTEEARDWVQHRKLPKALDEHTR